MIAQSDLIHGSIARSLARLAIPIVLANILQTAFQLTDTFWVGRLGAPAVAALSLSFPIIFLIISMGAGFSIAGTVLVAQYRGQNSSSKVIDHTASQTYLIMIVVALVLSALGYLSSSLILTSMNGVNHVTDMANDYLKISMIGLVFMYAYMMFQSLFRGIGNVTTPLWIVLISVLLNFVLDPLFILGYWIIPAGGVSGAAIATVATQGVAAILGSWFMWNGRHGFSISLGQMKPDFNQIKKIFNLGLPASAEQSTRGLGMIVMTFLVASFGTNALASYGIGLRVLSFVIIPALGFSMATSTLVGQNIGAKKYERARQVAKIANRTIFLILSGLGIFSFIFAEFILSIFIPGETVVIAEGGRFIRIISFTFGLIGVQQVVSGALRGGGSTMTAMLLAIVTLWIFRFPVAYILSKHSILGITGIWWSFSFSNLLAAFTAWIILVRGRWVKNVVSDFAPVERHVIEEAQSTIS